MNDRNAFLQGQGSPIKDDAPPPAQGWRGERAATEGAAPQAQSKSIPGSDARAEIVSGVAFAEDQGLQPANASDPGGERPESASIRKSAEDGHADSVHDLNDTAESPGGQSAGKPYPNPHHGGKADAKFGTTLGHGGQSEIAYHGPGHLGEQTVDDDDNRNGVAESNA